MHLRWKILAVLTLARTAMGFQFQVVTAAGTGLTQTFDLTGATLGLLIGLYLLPGIAVAIPGGWLGQRFGDKRVVLAGLAMMAGGARCSAPRWRSGPR
jgi:MFS family permease